ncbi:hypothetical protein D6C78_02985 [Aureobasidium pullulans]|uniref:Uncharacterized protein n=1 Tax=Aureobasidium pullulans TaxID=5580 RepID=A0A4T0C4U0_AURPU|nr:hypothetical protein D6C78_02985 [Aureobasidium pullulans]
MHIGNGAGDGNDEPGQADEHEQDASTSEISSEQPDNDTHSLSSDSHSLSSDSHSDEYEAGLENLDPDQPVQSTESGENTTDQLEAQDDRARFERTLMEAEIARLQANMSRRRQIESDLAGSTDSDSESPADDLETIDDNENTISPSPHSSDGEDLDEENHPPSVASRRHVASVVDRNRRRVQDPFDGDVVSDSSTDEGERMKGELVSSVRRSESSDW